jgi:neutral ceramidase
MRPWLSCGLVWLGLALPTAGIAEAEGGLRAGAAARTLVLPDAVPLAGYGARGPGNRADGRLEPVEARAVILEADGGRVGLVVLDALLVSPDLRRAIAPAASELELDLLVVAATHTHSGPGGYVDHWLAELSSLGWYREDVLPALADAGRGALADAAARLAPARVGSRLGPAPPFSHNRRREGGPTDPWLPVLRVDHAGGEPLATLFAFGSHPVALPAENRALSPDYPGSARRQVEGQRGGLALFLAGPLGDQNPSLPGSDLFDDAAALAWRVQAAAEVGTRLGDRVVEIADAITPIASPGLAWQRRDFELPRVDVRIGCAGYVLGPVLHRAARRLLSSHAPIDALRLGELLILAAPFELSVDVAREIRTRIGAPVLVVSHANDWLGYLVMPEDFDRGGYETCLSFHGRDLGPRFVAEAVAALEAVRAR